MSEEVVNTQMSVKRYDVEAYSWFGTAHWNLVESEVGDIIRAYDYDELRNRTKQFIAALGNIVELDFYESEDLNTYTLAETALKELL